MDVESVGDRQRGPGEQRVNDVERERHEHEGELQRFSDTGQECRQPSRREDAEGDLALASIGNMDHRQRGRRQAEHQDRIKAGGEMPAGGVAGGEPRQFTGDHVAVRRLVIAVDEPHVRVQNVVQANRNQHAVGEPVDERAESAGPTDKPAQAGQSGVEDRIEIAHRESDHQGGQRHRDRHETSTAEESEVRRQLDGVVPVKEPRGQQAHDDAAEHAVVDLGLSARAVDLTGEYERRHRLEHRLHHQVTNDRGQCGRAVGLAGKTNRHADSEQQRQVGEQRATGGAHRLEERADHRGLDPAEQVILAQSKENSRGR